MHYTSVRIKFILVEKAGSIIMNHQELVKVIQQELYNDDAVLALVLVGSVARHEETPNSDIDLFVITNKDFMQNSRVIRNGITVELIEGPLEQLVRKRVLEKEAVALNLMASGVLLFDKTSETEKLIAEAKEIIKEGPPIPTSHSNEQWKIGKRGEITGIYSDLLDIDDEINFNYIASILISSAIPLIFENNNLWSQSNRKNLDYLKSQCFNEYKNIETLLNQICSVAERRNAARRLVEAVLGPHGGMLEGDIVIGKQKIEAN